MRLENFPVVDAGLPRLSRIAEHKALFEFAKINPQFHAPFAAWRQFNRSGAAKRRRIMVLRSRWNLNHNAFRIAADMDPIDFALSSGSKTIHCRTNRHGHRARSADSRARRGLGIRRQAHHFLRWASIFHLPVGACREYTESTMSNEGFTMRVLDRWFTANSQHPSLVPPSIPALDVLHLDFVVGECWNAVGG